MSTIRKIDFFGGLHGNYLELIVNVCIDQNYYDLSKPLFTETGACHLKDNDPLYRPITKASHWSHFKNSFGPDDYVVQIVPTQQDMLIAVTNSFMRSGNQQVDLNNFEKDTIAKLKAMPKAHRTIDTVIADYGVRKDYPRSGMRNYFFSMFMDSCHGLDMYSEFDPTTPHTHQFPFRSFFNLADFCLELNKIAYFFNLEFNPTTELAKVHSDFLRVNQGLASEVKCNKIITAILSQQSIDIRLNIVEEAWINYMIANIFRCIDLPILIADQYPTNTLTIANEVFAWKQQNI